MGALTEKLREIVKNCGLTQYEIAKGSGMDRSMLNRVLNDKMRPTEKLLETFCRYLDLDELTRDEIYDLYEQNGDDGQTLYYQRREIMSLLSHLGTMDKLSNEPLFGNEVELSEVRAEDGKAIRILKDPRAVVNAMQDIVMHEYSRCGSCEIMMCTPIGRITANEVFNQMSLYLMDLSLRYDNMRITHLVGMDRRNVGSPLVNISVLSGMLHFALGAKEKYKAYYYKSVMSNQVNIQVITPYYIIVGKYVILLSSDCYGAIVLNDADVLKYYTSAMNTLKSSCIPFTTEYISAMQVLAHYDNIDKRSHHSTVSLMPHPPLCMLMSGDELVAYRRRETPGIETLAVVFRERFNQIHSSDSTSLISFCTLDGMRNFAETGYTSEIPKVYVNALPKSMRKCVIERMCDKIREGAELYMINSAKLQLPNNCSIKLLRGRVLDILVYDDTMTDVVSSSIADDSILEAFEDFCDYLPTSRIVYSREKTIELLTELADSLSD